MFLKFATRAELPVCNTYAALRNRYIIAVSIYVCVYIYNDLHTCVYICIGLKTTLSTGSTRIQVVVRNC